LYDTVRALDDAEELLLNVLAGDGLAPWPALLVVSNVH
jgi:hypothetical protein